MTEQSHVGWGGAVHYVDTDFEMGRGMTRGLPDYGLRRAVWDAAFGYVSGFPKLDILYYVLTRSLSHRVWLWAGTREGIEFRDGIPLARTSGPEAIPTASGPDLDKH